MNRKIYKKIERYKEVERFTQNDCIRNAYIPKLYEMAV